MMIKKKPNLRYAFHFLILTNSFYLPLYCHEIGTFIWILLILDTQSRYRIWALLNLRIIP